MPAEPDASLAMMFERSQAQAMVELSDESRPVADGWMTFAGVGAFVNKACGLGLAGPVPKGTVEEVIDFYATRGAEPKVELCPYVHPSLLQALGQHDFRLQEFENVLFRRLEKAEDLRLLLPGGWPTGLVVERVDAKDAQAVERYVDVTLSGFMPEGQPVSEGFRASALRAPQLPHYDSFLARLDGKPVGAGGSATRDNHTTLFGASVLPAYRKRGVQQALVVARLERARARGSALAIVVSHPGQGTERNAQRLGFHMAYSRAALVRPGQGLAPSP
jgi:GNAT superfamily N-acetyltransferase